MNDAERSAAMGEALAALAEVPGFSALDYTARKALVAGSSLQLLADGDILVTEGDEGEDAFLVFDGSVEIVTTSGRGTTSLATVPAPALIGEIGAFADLPRTATVRAVGEVSLLQIGRDALEAAARQAPDILFSVVSRLGGQIASINQALGLYAQSLTALEKADSAGDLLEDLNNPSRELGAFAEAFKRMARQIRDQQNRHAEMATAATIQQSLLPDMLDPAHLSGKAAIFARMAPAREIGGDFFDMFALPDGRVAFGIGDVCGKGVPASLFMAVALTVLRATLRDGPDLLTAVDRANTMLCRDNPGGLFTTLQVAIADTATGLVDYVGCGQNPALKLGADGAVSEIVAKTLPMGMFEDAPFTVQTVRLGPGERIVFFSDGVTEANDPDKCEYGTERMIALLGRSGGVAVSELVEGVFADVETFAAGADPSDDITCLCFGMN